MSVQLVGWAKHLHFGLGYPKENLPSGWTVKESEEDFAFGTAPDGKEYYLGLRHAYPCGRFETDKGRCKVGDRYIDMENGVIEFADTETQRQVPSLGVDQNAESPEGPGRDGHKPLMRNREAEIAPSPTCSTPGDPL